MIVCHANFFLLALVALVSAKNVSLYPPLYAKHSSSTPIFVNTTGQTANPLIRALGVDQRLVKRQSTSLPTGTCMRLQIHRAVLLMSVALTMGSAVRLMGTAPVAMSRSRHVQELPSTPERLDTMSHGKSNKVTIIRRIQSLKSHRSSTRSCDSRAPSDLDLTGFSHINFAFAFFNPTTFEITQMNAGDEKLYSEFTDMKSKYPGLQAYISIGGWSFNDDTNSPNTRTAFSDMVSSASNRAAFISSLSSFMQTYGFDGVDIDWEYPAASDRGGVPADTANFVSLVKELRGKFGTTKGVTATLPSSFWYLQGFDVVGMADYVDWFNFMSYDIHGVWDSTSKFTGPYIRPHTNWTEIAEGLDLLWRAGVAPQKVTLGLGWYGRSFTLADETCVTPNGICLFSAGGSPGECTQSSGTLSNAEIFRIIDEYSLEPTYDDDAAVNWVYWDETQWCLGGIMIWSIDQDNTNDDSMSDFLGIGPTNGNTAEETAELKAQLSVATTATAVQTSCYWSFCGQGCDDAYFPVTQAKGEVGNNGVVASVNTVCNGTDVQSLCCAPGTTLGTCQWEGYNGVGMACSAACSNDSAVVIAENTNHYYNDPETSTLEDQTCNGGFQAYCCLGFIASATANTGSLDLIDQTTSSKRSLQKRGVSGVAGRVCLSAAEIAVDAIAAAAAAWFTFGASEIAFAAEVAANVACLALAAAATVEAALHMLWFFVQNGLRVDLRADQIRKTLRQEILEGPRPLTDSGASQHILAPVMQYHAIAASPTHASMGNDDPFKSVQMDTNTRARMTATAGGWDEVCDNQRWAIDKLLNGRLADSNYAKAQWSPQHSGWQAAAQTAIAGVARCQVDEFPMGALIEGRLPNSQACRLVNGPANGRQGTDFQQFLLAQWTPCSSYKQNECGTPNPDVPITWAFSGMDANRIAGSNVPPHFVQHYGFDSQTVGSECWATATFNDPSGNPVVSTVTDHGFRVLNGDPMITSANYDWPLQSYRPSPYAGQPDQPSSIASAAYQKRQEALLSLQGQYIGSEINCEKCDVFIDKSGRQFYHPHWSGHPHTTSTTTAVAHGGTNVAIKAGSTPVNKVPRETSH
ncbi:hypothetical protein UA08_08920 [Talaromyces atroroseus]|uniref:chitinase n=1 Tax=Talaromyces atroroseus TaxID=1441469 RepID=A0A225A669_TALAT|nr:hypothetical protein UA08_08920 [Talaromyces atroroseus]OKL55832.1 hypothetical protein UA08_08920 [Talaromyces atroroseus]